jgi:3-hydroxybutyrate dehydrogenase
MKDLGGKCALVTGSVRGLGLAIAEGLADAGCNLVLSGFGADGDVEAIRRALETQHGVRALYSGADLRRPEDIEKMIAEGREAFGAIDILVNNAVVRHRAPVDTFSPDAWDEGLAVNLSAAFHTIRHALPDMKRKGWGRIVNVSSIYGLRGTTGRVGYVTCKTALIGLTRAVALETVGHGITCNAVCPATTDTPIHQAAVSEAVERNGMSRAEAVARLLEGKQPTGQFIAPGGVAALIVFLCRTEGADITGAVLPVDGGWSAG